jgi:hypothetical protein
MIGVEPQKATFKTPRRLSTSHPLLTTLENFMSSGSCVKGVG